MRATLIIFSLLLIGFFIARRFPFEWSVFHELSLQPTIRRCDVTFELRFAIQTQRYYVCAYVGCDATRSQIVAHRFTVDYFSLFMERDISETAACHLPWAMNLTTFIEMSLASSAILPFLNSLHAAKYISTIIIFLDQWFVVVFPFFS